MQTKNIKVLIAEDNTLVREMIQGILEDIGYTIIGKAADGLQAVEMAQSLKPDVILMDIEMPNMNGIEATQRIYELCPTPVVIMTAYENTELVEKANKARVGAYLVKPPKTRELERAITIAMGRFDDIMELRYLSAELQTRNEELDAFAHTVAHDLQSPLSVIIGYTDILRAEARLSDELSEYLNKIIRNSYKMSNITDELLLLSGVRHAEIELKPLQMNRIVAEARQRLIHMIEKYKAEITYPEYWPEVVGHAPWIEEVWVNYISNAIKYGGNPPRIQLGGTAHSNGSARFWIRDNGNGLTYEQQKRLFTPFTRFSQVQTDGHGLGLSIVKRIIDRLGGQVKVESDGLLGSGSTFIFILPTNKTGK